jgi:predicted dehydrogenase
VAQAYVRLAGALGPAGTPFEPDFAHALKRHRLIDAIERSAAEGRTITLEPSAIAR